MNYKLIVASVVLLGALFASNIFAQATNPFYIAEFPSVDRVMAGMKTADPDESATRQMAVFTWLMNMILEMAGPRQFIRGAGNTALYKTQKSDPTRESLRGTGQSYFPPAPSGPAN
jgi:hypothetical protein